MRVSATLLTALAGIILWGFALIHAADALSLSVVAAPGDVALVSPSSNMPAALERPGPGAIEERSVRVVDPDKFASPLVEGVATLERIDPREPLSREKDRPSVPLRMPRPQTTDAGIIQSGQKRIRLAGITPTEHDATCHSDNGETWPCGMMARTQQRLLLRNRTVDCDIDDGWTGERTASCHVNGIDIARWLVDNGWVRADQQSSLLSASLDAQSARKGLFGPDPR